MEKSEGLLRRYFRRLMTSFFARDTEEARHQEAEINRQVEKIKEMENGKRK